jgi:ATP-binding protein involved in chromosome partitioning
LKAVKAVMVLSGKGGVGKTLISVNLALALNEKGVKVGLLDADFSSSNSAYFLDLRDKWVDTNGEEFHPVEYKGIEVFSIPMVFGEKSVSMFGDQYGQLIRDAVNATWTAEYMIVDLPAGFGDELMTAARLLSDSLLGSIIVVQPAHYLDAQRALALHKDLEMPVLGLIENMSYFKVGEEKLEIFGESVVDVLAEEFKVPVFGKIPLSMDIRKQVGAKNPRLTGTFANPIARAVEAIMEAKPTKPGFIEKMKRTLKESVDKFVIQMGFSINKDLNIGEIQTKYGYPGGSIIRLNIRDDDMTRVISHADLVFMDGKLLSAAGEYDIDVQIDITVDALKYALLGSKKMSNGSIYSFEDALRLGQMRVYGQKSMARGAYFMRNVFSELANNQNAMGKLRPILEFL